MCRHLLLLGANGKRRPPPPSGAGDRSASGTARHLANSRAAVQTRIRLPVAWEGSTRPHGRSTMNARPRPDRSPANRARVHTSPKTKAWIFRSDLRVTFARSQSSLLPITVVLEVKNPGSRRRVFIRSHAELAKLMTAELLHLASGPRPPLNSFFRGCVDNPRGLRIMPAVQAVAGLNPGGGFLLSSKIGENDRPPLFRSSRALAPRCGVLIRSLSWGLLMQPAKPDVLRRLNADYLIKADRADE